MSMDASFHIFPTARIDILKQAVVPIYEKTKFLKFFTRTVRIDCFWAGFEAETEELASFDWSGYGFLHLEMLLNKKGVSIFITDEDDHGRFLGDAMDHTFTLFIHETAMETCARLEAAPLAEKEVRAYLKVDESQEDLASLFVKTKKPNHC